MYSDIHNFEPVIKVNISLCLLCAPFFEVGSVITLYCWTLFKPNCRSHLQSIVQSYNCQHFGVFRDRRHFIRLNDVWCKMFVRRTHTVIEDMCNCSLILRQKTLYQYRQRCNVPLLTQHIMYTDIIYGIEGHTTTAIYKNTFHRGHHSEWPPRSPQGPDIKMTLLVTRIAVQDVMLLP